MTVPFDGSQEIGLKFFPKKPGATRFITFTYPGKNDRHVPTNDPADWGETERLTPGMGEVISDPHARHITSTVDLEYVISGEMTLILDSGERTVVKAGDCLVQCGAQHSWANESDEPATILLVFVGANLDESRFATD